MKKILMVLVILFGCVMNMMAQCDNVHVISTKGLAKYYYNDFMSLRKKVSEGTATMPEIDKLGHYYYGKQYSTHQYKEYLIPQNFELAFKYFTWASNYTMIGEMYYHGLGVEHNLDSALNYYTKTNTNIIYANYYNGVKYFYGCNDTKQDLEASVVCFAKALTDILVDIEVHGKTNLRGIKKKVYVYLYFIYDHKLATGYTTEYTKLGLGYSSYFDFLFQHKFQKDECFEQLYQEIEHNFTKKDDLEANVVSINFLSSTTSSSTTYNLRAGIKSDSKITNVSVVVNNSRGITPIVNDGYDFTLNKNLTLNYGNNTITISVTNASGTTSKSFDVYVNQNSEKRVALIIGNAAYRNITPLKTPINDANDIASKLRTFKFDVTLKNNLTRSEFKSALNEFKYKANNSDVALIYYAGHGMEINETNYLFPIDISNSDVCDGNGIDASLDVLNAVSGAEKKIIIIDACRNNPCRGMPGFKRMSAKNAFFAYSASEGKLATDIGANGRNSPYAEALLRALNNKNLALPQLFQIVNNSITTGQNPTYTSSMSEDFIFNK